MTGIRKAAILVILLGEETAGDLLKQLPQDQARLIVKEVGSLDAIDTALADSVVEDYFFEAIRPEPTCGGADLAHRLRSRSSLLKEGEEDMSEGPVEVDDSHIKPLLEVSPRQLAETLAEEQSQTVALILLNLPTQRATEVLRALPEERKSEVLIRMAGLKQVRGDILGELISALEPRLKSQEAIPDKPIEIDSLQVTADVLSQLGRADARHLLELLKATDAERAEALGELVFTFDSLADADDRGIQDLLRQVETKNLALSLIGAGEEITGKVEANLSERAAVLLHEEMEMLEKSREEDRVAARKEILALAMQLEQDGKLEFVEAVPEEET